MERKSQKTTVPTSASKQIRTLRLFLAGSILISIVLCTYILNGEPGFNNTVDLTGTDKRSTGTAATASIASICAGINVSNPEAGNSVHIVPCHFEERNGPVLTETWVDVRIPKQCLYNVSNAAFLQAIKQLYTEQTTDKEATRLKIQDGVRLLQTLKCLGQGQAASTTPKTQNKYDGYSKTCSSHGMWNLNALPDLMCIFRQLVKTLHIRPYDVVLDWGGGCGHQLGLMGGLLGTFGVNIDLSPPGIAWGADHYKNVVGCAQDGTNLTNLPSNSVHHVISYAALMHIHPDVQCVVLKQMLRVIKKDGNIWVGWIKTVFVNGYLAMTCDMIRTCMADYTAQGMAEISICEFELKQWGVTAYNWGIHASVVITKLVDSHPRVATSTFLKLPLADASKNYSAQG